MWSDQTMGSAKFCCGVPIPTDKISRRRKLLSTRIAVQKDCKNCPLAVAFFFLDGTSLVVKADFHSLKHRILVGRCSNSRSGTRQNFYRKRIIRTTGRPK